MNLEYGRSISGILKITEMVFALIAFLILRFSDTGYFDVNAAYFGIGTLYACLLVTPLLFVTYLMGRMEIQKTVFEFSINFLFFFFLTIYGVMALVHYSADVHGSTRDCGITMGVFSLAAAAAYLGDTVMSIINYNN
ncbi:uncharacterized protein LOC108674705 [Hyalella azteca]|uniref:Uncharacterized protein LOC108674705 n=1 Tax=Hyalella azteca TaxID=294128 RepID=A0A8B7NWM4_HYAAZ|nr:uncharacterized protein LOC108674705 [Hyalella azteca]